MGFTAKKMSNGKNHMKSRLKVLLELYIFKDE